MHGPILELDPKIAENEVGNWWRTSYKLMKRYTGNQQRLKLSEAMRKDVGEHSNQLYNWSVFSAMGPIMGVSVTDTGTRWQTLLACRSSPPKR
jgi:hypothetical protein